MSTKYMRVAVIGLFVGIIALAFSLVAVTHVSGSFANSNDIVPQILSSGVLRACYTIYPPDFEKDPKTGDFSGIFYDITQAMAHNLGLKVELTKEVGYGDIFTALDAHQCDVFIGSVWPSSSRAKAGYFTEPAFYSAIYAYGRPDDHRFDNNLSAINSSSIRIAVIDGELEDIIAQTDYPNAQRISLPQLSSFSQNLLNITSGKADVTFIEKSVTDAFLKEHPGALRQLSATPVRVFGNVFAVQRGQTDLQNLLNVSLNELIYSGQVDSILKKYEITPDEFLRVAPPYKA